MSSTRKRKLIAFVVLAAALLAVGISCSRPDGHFKSVLLESSGVKPITASDMKGFRDMLDEVTTNVGSIADTSGGSEGRRVCVFEEKHSSVAGQLETAIMLLRLHDRYGLRHIALEGLTTDKPFPSTQWSRRMSGTDDEELRHDVLEVFVGILREGEISAVELIALAFPDVVIHAADDPSAYAVELTTKAGVASTNYLYKIGLKSVRAEHHAQLRQFNRRHKLAEMVEYVISLDVWARDRHASMKSARRDAPVEQTLRELREIEERAGSVGAEITADERSAMLDAQAFFEAADRRSATMVQVVRGLDPSARMVALNIGAAHTETVSRLFTEAGTTYAVLSPKALSENSEAGDIGFEGFERKGKALSVAWAGKGLGSLLDGRKKPLLVVDRTWLKADAQLRFATVLIARAQLGPGFPEPELRKRIDSLDHVKVQWDSVEKVGGDKLFKASALGEKGWTDIWGYCGKPRAEIIRRGRRSLEELLLENLNAVRQESGARREPRKGPVFELVTHDVIAAYAKEPAALKGVRTTG